MAREILGSGVRGAFGCVVRCIRAIIWYGRHLWLFGGVYPDSIGSWFKPPRVWLAPFILLCSDME